MTTTGLVLVHELFISCKSGSLGVDRSAVARRAMMFDKYGAALGVRNYEWVDGRDKSLANYFLRILRGTARAVDAVEIIELDETAVRVSLADEPMRALWRKTASCEVLRELGLGTAVAPPVFAELVVDMPPLNLAGLRAWRSTSREIGVDEKRHIDFGRSMLLLA